MINVLSIILLTILLLANLFLFLLIAWFSVRKNDTASKIGFGFMEIVFLANMLVVVGGIF